MPSTIGSVTDFIHAWASAALLLASLSHANANLILSLNTQSSESHYPLAFSPVVTSQRLFSASVFSIIFLALSPRLLLLSNSVEKRVFFRTFTLLVSGLLCCGGLLAAAITASLSLLAASDAEWDASGALLFIDRSYFIGYFSMILFACILIEDSAFRDELHDEKEEDLESEQLVVPSKPIPKAANTLNSKPASTSLSKPKPLDWDARSSSRFGRTMNTSAGQKRTAATSLRSSSSKSP
mmetsp:Transcript_1463/g.2635  ORF Transcript_1463/g.2635 Transcript_1463/m.2635 type:complete len:239 (-) Transcript_1463:728-1444(-)